MVVLMLPGCGGSGPKIVPVKGTVTYKGKPVPNLLVLFVNAEGRTSSGSTDENGAFTLRYDSATPGAALGSYKVYFKFRPRTPAEEAALHEGTLTVPPEVRDILERYGNPTTTTLAFEVAREGQTINISLD